MNDALSNYFVKIALIFETKKKKGKCKRLQLVHPLRDNNALN